MKTSKIVLPDYIDAIEVDPSLLGISQRLAQIDATIWGEGTEAATRLGWVTLPERSRSLLPLLDALTVRMRDGGFERIVLSGMGGSSLAPEVIAKSHRRELDRELITLDSTHPDRVRAIVAQNLKKTFFVVSSKSGTTIETNSHLAVIRAELREQGLPEAEHIIVVTDPGSPLESLARDNSWQYVAGDPQVGGRFSALSVFGLLPAALIGVDPSLLLDDAAEMIDEIHIPSVKIASFLASQRFIYIKDSGSEIPGLGDWIEQLIAESTGKSGVGVLPISLGESGAYTSHPTIDFSTSFFGPLGAHFILWEWVTALLGYLVKVDPFDQPDVQATKTKTSQALDSISSLNPAAHSIPLDRLASEIESKIADRQYIAICAYLDPVKDAQIFDLRELLERRFHIPVAFGWGPRFLHSTGQFHKGGPKFGLFLSITSSASLDLAIPGRSFGFEELIHAQAEGDRVALVESGSPVVNVHLDDTQRGIETLLKSFA